MTLSLEVMNNAVQKNDVNLDKSRFFATLARPVKILFVVLIMFRFRLKLPMNN